MTLIVVNTPFYLGRSAGKPTFYPAGRGDAPEADLKSRFGLALEKGGCFVRVKAKETGAAGDAGAGADTAKKTVKKPKAAPVAGDAAGQDADAGTAKESDSE